MEQYFGPSSGEGETLPPHWTRVTAETIADGTTPAHAIVRAELREIPSTYLRDGRYCSAHDVDLVPPDRSLSTRRYCYQCPPGSRLGPPVTWSP